jgi:hypothetical protein
MGVSQVLQEVVFPCTPWPIGETKAGPAIQAIPGTWTLPPEEIRNVHPNVRGILACPKCATPCLIPQGMGKKTSGKFELIIPTLQCNTCRFAFLATLEDWEKRQLFCVAYETWDVRNKRIIPHKIYMHAESADDALRQFNAAHVNDTIYNVVGASLVIGYKVEDSKGKSLSV